MKLMNNGQKRLGVLGRRPIIIEPGKSSEISEGDLAIITGNRTVAKWIKSGLLSVIKEGSVEVKIEKPVATKSEPEPEFPDGVTGEGVEKIDTGRGWFEVYVSGIKVTDKKVR